MEPSDQPFRQVESLGVSKTFWKSWRPSNNAVVNALRWVLAHETLPFDLGAKAKKTGVSGYLHPENRQILGRLLNDPRFELGTSTV